MTTHAPRLFRAALAVAIALVLLRFWLQGQTPHATLIAGDNDDMMRLLSVRGWFAGQSWFDMAQPRLMPPEGVDMHWSRYVDLGIAALLWPLAQLLPMDQAEAVTLVAWPALLAVLHLVVVARVSLRVFGPVAAVSAMLFVLLWPVLAQNYFTVARLDHHNVQILLNTVVLASLLGGGRPVRRGLIGGGAAALSLAVGLEALLLVILAGLILLARALWQGGAAAGQLLTYCSALLLGSLGLFVGQTAPRQWGIAHCDVVAPPILLLLSVAAVVAGAVWGMRGRGRPARALVALAVAGGGLALAWPIIGPCSAGPYGALPEALKDLIATRISEGRPLALMLRHGEPYATRAALPLAAALLLALAGAWRDRARRGDVIVLLLAAGLGVLSSLHQIRMLVVVAPAAPLLAGYALSRLVAARRAAPASPWRGLALVAGAALMFLGPVLVDLTRPASPATAATRVSSRDCRSAPIVDSLRAVSQGTILAALSMGAPILLRTDHSALAAPYHRSPEAFLNGYTPFAGDEAQMRATLARYGADYLLLCRGAEYYDPDSFATALSMGAQAKGLSPVAGVDPALLLLRVE